MRKNELMAYHQLVDTFRLYLERQTDVTVDSSEPPTDIFPKNFKANKDAHKQAIDKLISQTIEDFEEHNTRREMEASLD